MMCFMIGRLRTPSKKCTTHRVFLSHLLKGGISLLAWVEDEGFWRFGRLLTVKALNRSSLRDLRQLGLHTEI